MAQIPESMVAELSEWNNGRGISLEDWTGCTGNFKLAVGYAAIFWPRFDLVGDYILREGYSGDSLPAYEEQCKGDKKSVEWVFNHLHIADIQYVGCEDISEDKIMILGRTLRDMWAAKLKWQFPERPCEVEFYEPENRKDLVQFQVTFWQKKHEQTI